MWLQLEALESNLYRYASGFLMEMELIHQKSRDFSGDTIFWQHLQYDKIDAIMFHAFHQGCPRFPPESAGHWGHF